MRRFGILAAALLLGTPVMADYVRVEAEGSVAEVSDRLVAAVEGAGAKVFARVPHSKGAMSVDMDLQDAELSVINAELGFLKAKYDYLLTVAKLANTVGLGEDFICKK